MDPKSILIVLGTRPEAIKLAPVILRLGNSDDFKLRLIFTGQHKDLVQPIFDFFGISAEYNLNIMRAGQSLHSITDRILKDITPILNDEQPDAVMVQGDTTTAYLAAHAAFYQQIPVIHVEAGLRSGNRYNPFPEEINRRLITQLSSVHLAATDYNRKTLLRENIPSESVYVTGNPVIDALQYIQDEVAGQERNSPILQSIPEDHRILLLTTHRRENWGEEQEEIFHAVKEIIAAFEDVEVVFPAHPNPVVMDAAKKLLGNQERIHLTESLDYFHFLDVMRNAYLILTDSGGVQEEAPVFGKPVLILRETTERKEILESGQGKLVGTDRHTIVKETELLLSQSSEYQRMSLAQSLYGDGEAAEQIEKVLQQLDWEKLSVGDQ